MSSTLRDFASAAVQSKRIRFGDLRRLKRDILPARIPGYQPRLGRVDTRSGAQEPARQCLALGVCHDGVGIESATGGGPTFAQWLAAR